MSNDILTPRDYQQKCIDAVASAKHRGVQRPVVVLPTGAGKTVIFAHLAKLFREAFPSRKVVIIAHTDELVRQAARKVKAVAPNLRVGIVMADRHEIWADVIVASVQTLRQPGRLADVKGVGLIVVDECHHAAAVSYKTILRHYGALPEEGAADPTVNGTSDVLAVGFTATLTRGDKAALAHVWQEVVFTRDIAFMIERGYLVRPHGVSIEVPGLDLSKVKTQNGDYQAKALSTAVVKAMVPELVARAYREHAADRPGVLFWPTVETAYAGAEAMRAQGFTCETIEGDMPRDERRLFLKRAAEGDLQTLSSCMVLTEGFDNPRMSCAVIARPTRHGHMYQQMVGRVLRPDPGSGKIDALVIDTVGAGKQHTLSALIDLTAPDREEEAESRELGPDEGRPVVAGAGSRNLEIPYSGDTVALEFDPLARDSKRVWQATEGTGTRFLAAGTDFYVFLAPGAIEGNWTVCWARHRNLVRSADPYANGGPTVHAEIPLETAMAWAEQMVDEEFGASEDYGRKKASWRTGRPSGKQVGLAVKLRIPLPVEWDPAARENAVRLTAGQLADMIDRRMASKRIDPIIQTLTTGR